ncbi:hypothetical protein [Flavobacterium sp. ENC]|uniref:hypothetical protein n=1 Tax=Flavobacterium sp. ENC TaxID=2897330 RepID=UPI001E2DCB3D|nr:hypothetical protein [Flavobacterium sp. ENC]MCD0467547.1 hypothetical protein [Flavobacterium sp. ENC]
MKKRFITLRMGRLVLLLSFLCLFSCENPNLDAEDSGSKTNLAAKKSAVNTTAMTPEQYQTSEEMYRFLRGNNRLNPQSLHSNIGNKAVYYFGKLDFDTEDGRNYIQMEENMIDFISHRFELNGKYLKPKYYDDAEVLRKYFSYMAEDLDPPFISFYSKIDFLYSMYDKNLKSLVLFRINSRKNSFYIDPVNGRPVALFPHAERGLEEYYGSDPAYFHLDENKQWTLKVLDPSEELINKIYMAPYFNQSNPFINEGAPLFQRAFVLKNNAVKPNFILPERNQSGDDTWELIDEFLGPYPESRNRGNAGDCFIHIKPSGEVDYFRLKKDLDYHQWTAIPDDRKDTDVWEYIDPLSKG